MNTPTATDTATSEPDMMKIALEADQATSTEPTPEQTPAAGNTATAPQNDAKPGEQGDSAKVTADKATADKPADGKDGQGKTDKKGGEADTKPGAESEFVKAKKEAERRDRSWKALEEEKAAFRAEKGALAAELEGLRREVATLKTRRAAGPATDANGATADTYEQLAKRFESEGQDDLAREAKARAAKLRQQESSNEAAAPAGKPWEAPEFQSEWQRNVNELIQQDKTLADPENPVFKETNRLVNDPNYGRFFRSHPDGIKAAVEVARLMNAVSATKELQTKLAAADEQSKKDKAEIARLNGLLQPRGSLPTTPITGTKNVAEMNDADAQAHVLAIAAAADRGELES